VFKKIQSELEENMMHTINNRIIINYCSDFMAQMITRSQTNKSIITQIENILNKYFTETKLRTRIANR
jgi:transcriptional regulatory protein LevR